MANLINGSTSCTAELIPALSSGEIFHLPSKPQNHNVVCDKASSAVELNVKYKSTAVIFF